MHGINYFRKKEQNDYEGATNEKNEELVKLLKEIEEKTDELSDY